MYKFSLYERFDETFDIELASKVLHKTRIHLYMYMYVHLCFCQTLNVNLEYVKPVARAKQCGLLCSQQLVPRSYECNEKLQV